MKKSFIMVGIVILLISIGLCGCTENNKVSNTFTILIDNSTSSDISVNIKIVGSGFSYNRDIPIKMGASNTTTFNLQLIEQHVNFTITASYVDRPDISQSKDSGWNFSPTPEGWNFHFKVYGSIAVTPPSIDIQGPL